MCPWVENPNCNKRVYVCGTVSSIVQYNSTAMWTELAIVDHTHSHAGTLSPRYDTAISAMRTRHRPQQVHGQTMTDC